MKYYSQISFISLCVVICHELFILYFPARENEILRLSLGLVFFVSIIPFFKKFLDGEPIPGGMGGIWRDKSPVLFWILWIFYLICILTAIISISWELIQKVLTSIDNL